MSGNDYSPARLLLDDAELSALVAGELGTYGRLKPGAIPRRWQFSLPRRNGEACLCDGWLILDFAPRGRPPAPLRLLERNRDLTGNARFCICDDGAIRLRAEIPIDGVPIEGLTGIGQHIRDGVLGLAGALGTPIRNLPAEVIEPDHAPATPVADICSESGWAFADSGDGRIRVELEVADDAFCQATVGLESARIVQRATPFAGVAAPNAESSRLALAALLLSVSGCVRMTRAISWHSEGGAVPGFEVSLPVTTSAAVFGRGLAALSVAIDMCGREALALAVDPSLAQAFLDIRHPRLTPRSRPCVRSASSRSSPSTSSR